MRIESRRPRRGVCDRREFWRRCPATRPCQGLARPLAEALAVLDGEAPQMREPEASGDRGDAVAGSGLREGIARRPEPLKTQVAHRRHAREVAEMLDQRAPG